MTPQLCTTYTRFRTAGMRANHALQAARTLLAFEAAEEQGVVRLRTEPEEESYFAV